jgi:hypothetical protein
LEQTLNSANTRYNALSAAVVFFVSFAVYLTTVAPTVAFWDCGEYIAAGHSLGIPHPPGNPLFVLVMRVSSMFLPFFEDVGYRMNFIVALSSSLTAVFIYLVIVEAAKMFIGVPDTLQKRVALYGGGLVGGLFAAFGYTFWFSAVETSVYNLSMLNIAICTWLMLRWAQSKNADRDKLLILVAFLGFLGIGLHMYTMIIFPPAFLFMVMWDEKKRKDWRLWITGILMASIIYSLSIFIKVGPAVLIMTLIMSLTSTTHRREWRLCFFFALFAILGYSVHIFIPIRSALEPMINENHPATWEALIGFLERRQYGSESMISRMFWRRGLWSSQFGIEGHMGFGGFHLTQFFRFDLADTERSFFNTGFTQGMAKLILYLIPTALMIYGWWYLYKKNRPTAVFLVSLVLLTTIGMVFYMNFADGKRPERFDYEQWMRMGQQGPMPTVHREVRVRDYFFTAGFMYFGMWVGLASACLMHALFNSKEKIARTVTAPLCAVVLIVSPVIPAVSNYKLSTRAGDWVAYDYAYNLLNSCAPNGIIFTNGDNDTFPLWALQEAYGIRNDVRVVNLSLLNTDWYIKQLQKLEPRVPISYTEDEIDRLQAQINPFQEPRMHTLRGANLTFLLPGIQQRRVLRVQDMMVLNIVDANRWSKPIYFAMTVSEDNLMGLTPFLQAQGLVYKLMPERVTAENFYDLDRTVLMVDSVFSLQGIGQARNNDTSRRLLTNYLQIAFDLRNPMNNLRREVGMLRTLAEDEAELMAKTRAETGAAADADSAAGESVKTEEKSRLAQQFMEAENRYNGHRAAVHKFFDRSVEMMPWDWRPRAIRHEFFIEHDMIDEAIAAMERALLEDRDPENRVQYQRMMEQAQNEKGKR